MALYQLNMAREQVLTLEKRRVWLRWVFSYLAVSALVIAVVAYHLATATVGLSVRRGTVEAREKQFLKQRPGVLGLDEHLNKVTAELVGVTTSLEAVVQFRTMGPKSADIMLGFAELLPQGVNLGKLALDGAEGTVKVEVYVPASMKREGSLTLPNMISSWEGSSLLTNRVRQITSENSQRVNFEGIDYLSWRFTGILEKDH